MQPSLNILSMPRCCVQVTTTIHSICEIHVLGNSTIRVRCWQWVRAFIRYVSPFGNDKIPLFLRRTQIIFLTLILPRCTWSIVIHVSYLWPFLGATILVSRSNLPGPQSTLIDDILVFLMDVATPHRRSHRERDHREDSSPPENILPPPRTLCLIVSISKRFTRFNQIIPPHGIRRLNWKDRSHGSSDSTRKRGDYLFPKADPPHDDHWHDESGPITQYQRPWLCQRRYFSQPASASRDSPHIYRQNLSYVGLQVCVTLDYAHRY